MRCNKDAAPVHPGQVLADELAELAISTADFAAALSIPAATAEALLAQRIGITPELTLRISHYFGTTARFWTDLQDAYDLHVAERKHGAAIAAQIKPLASQAYPNRRRTKAGVNPRQLTIPHYTTTRSNSNEIRFDVRNPGSRTALPRR